MSTKPYLPYLPDTRRLATEGSWKATFIAAPDVAFRCMWRGGWWAVGTAAIVSGLSFFGLGEYFESSTAALAAASLALYAFVEMPLCGALVWRTFDDQSRSYQERWRRCRNTLSAYVSCGVAVTTALGGFSLAVRWIEESWAFLPGGTLLLGVSLYGMLVGGARLGLAPAIAANEGASAVSAIRDSIHRSRGRVRSSIGLLVISVIVFGSASMLGEALGGSISSSFPALADAGVFGAFAVFYAYICPVYYARTLGKRGLSPAQVAEAVNDGQPLEQVAQPSRRGCLHLR